MLSRLFPLLLCGLYACGLSAQTDIAALIAKYQKDPRGPYRDIAWFCADGMVVPSLLGGCDSPDEKNKQHARYKGDVIKLGKNEHIFLAQILTNTKQTAFWDEANDHSRMKQYMLGNYLAAIDDGWVNRTGQYYRGAFQIEDEMEWGRDYLNWVMSKETALKENFYLIRQAVRDIPHREDDDPSNASSSTPPTTGSPKAPANLPKNGNGRKPNHNSATSTTNSSTPYTPPTTSTRLAASWSGA